jgi:hypothetical protein
LNTLNQRSLFLILLGGTLLFLPACGSKTAVKSERASETVLNPETTPVGSGMADIGDTGRNTPINTYVEKIGHKKKTIGSLPSTSTTTNTIAPIAETPAPANTPAMETAAPVAKSGGSHLLLWLLLIIVLGGVGWYFWSKNHPEDHVDQPMPPVGGLSPVSGFTALKDQIEEESPSETSFWSKKIF